MVRCTVCLLFLLLVVICRLDISWTRPHYLPRSKENDLIGIFTRHRNQCTDVAGPCYSSGNCCKGLVCMPRDNDPEGTLSELLGQCIRESDLEACETSADCPSDCRCIEFGRRRAKYCLPRSIRRMEEPEEPTPAPVLRTSRPPSANAWRQSYFKVNGGFGSYCEANFDCSPLTEQGAPLCCQQVRRGRQLPKKMCDYLTPISACIS